MAGMAARADDNLTALSDPTDAALNRALQARYAARHIYVRAAVPLCLCFAPARGRAPGMCSGGWAWW